MDKKKLKLDTLMLWCLSQNGVAEENIASCDAVYRLNHEKYGFITEFDRTENELRNAIKDSIPYLDYIYVLTDTPSKIRKLSKQLPQKIGVLSDCDAYGLGMTISVQKSAVKL